jgi:hypothetical protein
LQLALRNALNLHRLLVNKSPRESSLQPEKFEGLTRCKERCVFCRDIKATSPVQKVPQIFSEKLPKEDSGRKHYKKSRFPLRAVLPQTWYTFVALHTAGSLETEKSSCKATQTKPGVR